MTLTGVGGVGKTRLALEVAAGGAADYPDGVWLCELAPLPDAGPVVQAVAAALRAAAAPRLTIEQTSSSTCGTRLLLVLDNCEHVLDAAAELRRRAASRRARRHRAGHQP